MNEQHIERLWSGSESPDPDLASLEVSASVVQYDVVALSMTIYYNREGDHDHNGMLFALEANRPVLEYIDALARQGERRESGSTRRQTRRRCSRRHGTGPRSWVSTFRSRPSRRGNRIR